MTAAGKQARMDAVLDALRAALSRLETKYNLTPLELAAALSTELAARLTVEATEERMAVDMMMVSLGGGGHEEDAEEPELPYTGTKTDPLNLNPMCCRKHNMMGRVRGECAGGGVGDATPAKTGLTEIAPVGPSGYVVVGEPGELEA